MRLRNFTNLREAYCRVILYYPFLSRLWLTLGYLFAKGESLWIFFGFKIGVKEVVVSIYSMLMIPSFSQSLKKSIVCNIKMTITSFKGCRISKSLGKSSMGGLGPQIVIPPCWPFCWVVKTQSWPMCYLGLCLGGIPRSHTF